MEWGWPSGSWPTPAFGVPAAAARYYHRARDRSAPHWRITTLSLIFALSCAWAASPWMLPLRGNLNLTIALAACIIGTAVHGASALNAGKLGARLFMVTMLGSMILYSLTVGGPFGCFGMAGIGFFLFVRWREAQRTHHVYGQLLFMNEQKFKNE